MQIDGETTAMIEEASDEIGRLDEVCRSAAPCHGLVLMLVAVAELTDRTSGTFTHLLASEADTLHEATLLPQATRWRLALADEERRVRGGAFLSASRLADLVPALTNYVARDRLEEIWRERGRVRPVLLRALDSAAWFPKSSDVETPESGSLVDGALDGGSPEGESPETGKPAAANAGDACAALLLCGGGRTDHLRCLPFATVRGDARARAIRSWRAGEHEPWSHLALPASALRARQLRDAVRTATDSMTAEDERVGEMGRAGITAARALGTLRRLAATSMPALADELGISRPAAAASLERLTDAGLAREVTGRARDRVYAYEAALSVGEGALAS